MNTARMGSYYHDPMIQLMVFVVGLGPGGFGFESGYHYATIPFIFQGS